MSKRTYTWDPEQGCTVEVTPGYIGQRRDGGLTSEGEIYGKLQATDGADISSRKKHREYMKAKGLAMTSDYTETWAKQRAERERLRGVGSGTWGDGRDDVPVARGREEYSRNLDGIRRAVAEAAQQQRSRR